SRSIAGAVARPLGRAFSSDVHALPDGRATAPRLVILSVLEFGLPTRTMQIIDTPATSPVSFSPLVRQYTLEEFRALPEPTDQSHYELIKGYLFMVPPPDWPHEDFDARLNRSLVLFVASHGDPGKVYHPQAPIYTDDTYLEPDMMYVSNTLAEKMGK